MADTIRITVTLPAEQVAALKKVTDNVSSYVAEAVARRLRHQLREEELRRYQEENGAFSDEELQAAHDVVAEALKAAGKRAAA